MDLGNDVTLTGTLNVTYPKEGYVLDLNGSAGKWKQPDGLPLSSTYGLALCIPILTFLLTQSSGRELVGNETVCWRKEE